MLVGLQYKNHIFKMYSYAPDTNTSSVCCLHNWGTIPIPICYRDVTNEKKNIEESLKVMIPRCISEQCTNHHFARNSKTAGCVFIKNEKWWIINHTSLFYVSFWFIFFFTNVVCLRDEYSKIIFNLET